MSWASGSRPAFDATIRPAYCVLRAAIVLPLSRTHMHCRGTGIVHHTAVILNSRPQSYCSRHTTVVRCSMDDAAEQAVGISVYTNSCPGFTAILKHRWVGHGGRGGGGTWFCRDARPSCHACRFTDFKVNEVNLEGQVVRLTSLKPPPVRHRWSVSVVCSWGLFAASAQCLSVHKCPL